VLMALALIEFDVLAEPGRLGTAAARAVRETADSRAPQRVLEFATCAVLFVGCVEPAALGFSSKTACMNGAFTAALLAALLWPWWMGQANLRSAKWAWCNLLALMLVGATFGWQAACGIGAGAALARLMVLLLARVWLGFVRMGWLLWLIAGTLVWLTLAPRVLPNCEPRPLGVVFVTGVLVASLALLGRALAGQQARRSLLPGG
jgi:hypothetical protein